MFKIKYLVVILSLSWCQITHAQTPELDVIDHMEQAGYRLVLRQTTLLGRVVLEFHSQSHERQIIIQPNTGEIIRDYRETLDDDSPEDDESNDWLKKWLDPFYGDDDD